MKCIVCDIKNLIYIQIPYLQMCRKCYRKYKGISWNFPIEFENLFREFVPKKILFRSTFSRSFLKFCIEHCVLIEQIPYNLYNNLVNQVQIKYLFNEPVILIDKKLDLIPVNFGSDVIEIIKSFLV